MLTSEQVDAYRRDGVLRIEGVVVGEELDRLLAATERLQEEAIAYGRELDSKRALNVTEEHGFRDWDELDERMFLYGKGAGGERIWRRAEKMWARDEIFRITTVNPVLLNAVHQIVGTDFVPANDSMVVKMAGGGAAVPFHRDPPGEILLETVGDASSDFTCDIYLDPARTENGALRAIPGSHRRPGIPDDALDFNQPDQLLLETNPGDVLLHSTGVLHGSPTNRSASQRRTFYIHYRPIEVLSGSWWKRSPEWIAEQVELMHRMMAERAACNWLTDPEEYIGRVPEVARP